MTAATTLTKAGHCRSIELKTAFWYVHDRWVAESEGSWVWLTMTGTPESSDVVQVKTSSAAALKLEVAA